MYFGIGDVVYTKKPHPCGGHEWEVLRVGMDFRIKCLKCGHLVMLPRTKFEKSIKKVISRGPVNADGDAIMIESAEKH